MEQFLISANLKSIPAINPEVVVVGGGIAGLRAALSAAEQSDVLLLVKGSMGESATDKAQGGIAAALDEDSWESHYEDTLRVGAGLCDSDTVKIVVSEGMERVRELVEMGVPFDRIGPDLAFTLEGGHSHKRILHADGDATGHAISQVLAGMVKKHPRIEVLENHFVIDLLHHEGRCYGLLCQDSHYGRLLRVDSHAVVISSGGLGQVYRETTNPEIATGDGYAMCFRAGAELTDMEFVQFHPTTLYLAGAPRFLISEAVRGEGAYLLTLNGDRFMPDVHPQAELAPRDVVSQAIMRVMNETQTSHVQLDLRHLPEELISRRFPNIRALCGDYGIDITKTPIPVRPAAHYMMGGVVADHEARTNVESLYVCGEVAATGIHGANRLASNSLLEGLVFGHRAGTNAAREARNNDSKPRLPLNRIEREYSGKAVPLDIGDVTRSLRALAWRNLGIYRSSDKLKEAEKNIAFWERYVLREEFAARAGFETQNMLTVASLIARSALLREESRGAHQRFDFPDTRDEWKKHTVLAMKDFD